MVEEIKNVVEMEIEAIQEQTVKEIESSQREALLGDQPYNPLVQDELINTLSGRTAP